jgi:hypothetical protein
MPCEDAPCCGCCGLAAQLADDASEREAMIERMLDYDDRWDDSMNPEAEDDYPMGIDAY